MGGFERGPDTIHWFSGDDALPIDTSNTDAQHSRSCMLLYLISVIAVGNQKISLFWYSQAVMILIVQDSRMHALLVLLRNHLLHWNVVSSVDHVVTAGAFGLNVVHPHHLV